MRINLLFLTFLLYFFAFLWVAFAVIWLFRNSEYSYFYAIYGMIYAVLLFLSAYLMNKKYVWAWRVAVFVVGISILASIFDQIGWIELVYIIGATFLFILLIKVRPLIKERRD